MSVVVLLRLTIVFPVVLVVIIVCVFVVSLLDIENERSFLGEVLRNNWSDVDYDKDKYNR